VKCRENDGTSGVSSHRDAMDCYFGAGISYIFVSLMAGLQQICFYCVEPALASGSEKRHFCRVRSATSTNLSPIVVFPRCFQICGSIPICIPAILIKRVCRNPTSGRGEHRPFRPSLPILVNGSLAELGTQPEISSLRTLADGVFGGDGLLSHGNGGQHQSDSRSGLKPRLRALIRHLNVRYLIP